MDERHQNQTDFNILIVDDTPKNLQVLGNILRQEEYKVEFSMNGPATLDWVEKKEFDLILLDIMMPEMDGYEVCKRLKANSKVKHVPIIFLTAKTDIESVVKGFDLGAIDYITKPFNKSELLSRVATQLDLKRSHDAIKKYSNELEIKNDQITDSINYAQYIQNAILPQENILEEIFSEFFVLFKPRDIVSGDFYWIRKVDEKTIIAVVDCTGHGVPGAMMSMLGYSGLNQAIDQHHIYNPAEILRFLHDFINKSLNKEEQNDINIGGMDVSIFSIDRLMKKIEFAGANNQLILISAGKLTEYKGDRNGIGEIDKKNVSFKNQTFDCKKGDLIYLYSDGYIDQFGGDNDKKFLNKNLKELLLKIHTKPLKNQSDILDNTIIKWIGNGDQVDDITILGVKI